MNNPSPQQTPPPVEQLTYEQALAELENIVTTLEHNEHTLEDALALYERGQALLRHCRRLLEKAELKVLQLNNDRLEPFVPHDV